jgi:hypothetical protein
MATAARRSSQDSTTAPVADSQVPRLDPVKAIFDETVVLFQPTTFGAPLVGKAPTVEELLEKIKRANLLQTEKKEESRVAYHELLLELDRMELPPHSIFRAACELGLALTYPEKSPEIYQHAALAQREIDKIYEHRILWDDSQKGSSGKVTADKTSWKFVDTEEKKATYTELIRNYNTLLHLVKEEDQREITRKIEDCKRILTSLEKPALPQKTPAEASHRQPSSAEPPKAAVPKKETPKRVVTPEPVGKSSVIKMIFGVAIISLAALIGSVVFYKRFIVKK